MGDADGDRVGDNADAFPDDAGESADLDGDGIGDNADRDDDGDGVADADDLFPRLAAKSALTSYKLVGEAEGDQAGIAVASLLNAGREQFVIGAPNHEGRGAAYAIAASEMPAADAADGRADRRVDLRSVVGLDDSWKLLGEGGRVVVFGAVAVPVGDVDGDGIADIALGAPGTADTSGTLDAAYVVTAKIAQADDADGHADRVVDMRFALDADGLVWKLTRKWRDMFGWSMSALAGGDGGTGAPALIFGAPGFGDGSATGAVEIVPARALRAEIDALNLRNRGEGWRLVGENAIDQAGFSVASDRDVNGDGLADILIGAPRHPAAYLLSSASLQAADDADGDADGVIELARVANLTDGWKFVGDGAGGHVSTAGDIDGDGIGDILIGTALHGKNPAAYLVSGAQLPAADEADGSVDGVVDLGRVASLVDCWKFVGPNYAVSAGDVDGDGDPDLLLRTWAFVYLISRAALASADSADGSADGVIELAGVRGRPVAPARQTRGVGGGSWVFTPGPARIFGAAEGVGDLDGDGSPDIALGVLRNDSTWRDDPGTVYFVSATDLPILDAADGRDGVVDLNVVRQRTPWEPTF